MGGLCTTPAGCVLHVTFLKFKFNTPAAKVADIESTFQGLQSKLGSLLSGLEWGRNHSPGRLSEGFTHIFALSFPCAAGLRQYLSHPEYARFCDRLLPHQDKLRVLHFSPASDAPVSDAVPVSGADASSAHDVSSAQPTLR